MKQFCCSLTITTKWAVVAQSIGNWAEKQRVWAPVQMIHGKCSGSGEGLRTPSEHCWATFEQGTKSANARMWAFWSTDDSYRGGPAFAHCTHCVPSLGPQKGQSSYEDEMRHLETILLFTHFAKQNYKNKWILPKKKQKKKHNRINFSNW